jgi:hypothetical protein
VDSLTMEVAIQITAAEWKVLYTGEFIETAADSNVFDLTITHSALTSNLEPGLYVWALTAEDSEPYPQNVYYPFTIQVTGPPADELLTRLTVEMEGVSFSLEGHAGVYYPKGGSVLILAQRRKKDEDGHDTDDIEVLLWSDDNGNKSVDAAELRWQLLTKKEAQLKTQNKLKNLGNAPVKSAEIKVLYEKGKRTFRRAFHNGFFERPIHYNVPDDIPINDIRSIKLVTLDNNKQTLKETELPIQTGDQVYSRWLPKYLDDAGALPLPRGAYFIQLQLSIKGQENPVVVSEFMIRVNEAVAAMTTIRTAIFDAITKPVGDNPLTEWTRAMQHMQNLTGVPVIENYPGFKDTLLTPGADILIIAAHGGQNPKRTKFAIASSTLEDPLKLLGLNGEDWTLIAPDFSERRFACRLAIVIGCNSGGPGAEEFAKGLGAEIYIGLSAAPQGAPAIKAAFGLANYINYDETIEESIRRYIRQGEGNDFSREKHSIPGTAGIRYVVFPPEAWDWKLLESPEE